MLQRGSHKEALQNFELALRLDPKHRVSITPMVKKAGLDATDVSFYRPISNLPVLSKLLEPLVVRQVTEYLSSADLLPSLQSGFRPGHSTETAVLRVLSNILQTVDRGDSAALILLDFSAAFDTVDHPILLQRLQTTFGVHVVAHRWFQSYLSGCYQYVRRGQVSHLQSYLRRATKLRTGANLVRSVHHRPHLAH